MGTEKPKIIYADNERSIQAVIGRRFPLYDFDFVNNADSLVAQIRNNPLQYSLIMSDLDMEDNHAPNSGTYAAVEIRKFDLETPIILLTGSNLTKDKVKQFGINDLFIKGKDPIGRLEELLKEYVKVR